MTDGVWAVLVTTSSLVVGYAAWWLVRHEVAVRRFRAQMHLPGSGDRR